MLAFPPVVISRIRFGSRWSHFPWRFRHGETGLAKICHEAGQQRPSIAFPGDTSLTSQGAIKLTFPIKNPKATPQTCLSQCYHSIYWMVCHGVLSVANLPGAPGHAGAPPWQWPHSQVHHFSAKHPEEQSEIAGWSGAAVLLLHATLLWSCWSSFHLLPCDSLEL